MKTLIIHLSKYSCAKKGTKLLAKKLKLFLHQNVSVISKIADNKEFAKMEIIE